MKKWNNLLLLAMAYFAGSAISSMYSKKTKEEIQTEIKVSKIEWESPLKVLFWNFLEIHKGLFTDVKENVATEENIEKFNDKKEIFKKVMEDYKKEWEEILKDLMVNWKDYSKEVISKLNDLYDEKKQEIDKIK